MATTAYGWDSFYSTTLSGAITSSDTTIPVVTPPTATEGTLVIESDSASNREIIYYTSVSGNNLVLPSVGAGRGQEGTTAVAHSSGVMVKKNTTSRDFEVLKDGTALSNAIITPSKLSTGATAAIVATSEATTSNSFTDLATSGPAVTVTIGANGIALVGVYRLADSATVGARPAMGFAVSGATTVAAADNFSVYHTVATSASRARVGAAFLVTGLTAGSNTFTAKYENDAGTDSVTFSDRRIWVLPL